MYLYITKINMHKTIIILLLKVVKEGVNENYFLNSFNSFHL